MVVPELVQRCFAFVGVDEEILSPRRRRQPRSPWQRRQSPRRHREDVRQQALDFTRPPAPPDLDFEDGPPLPRGSLVQIRPRSLHPQKVTRRERGSWAKLPADWDKTRPLTRGECVNGPRPCPFVSCKHHLYLTVNQYGSIKLSFPDIPPDRMDLMEETCALDVADNVAGDSMPLEEVGARLGMTLERARQIQELGLHKLRTIMLSQQIGEGQVDPDGVAILAQLLGRTP